MSLITEGDLEEFAIYDVIKDASASVCNTCSDWILAAVIMAATIIVLVGLVFTSLCCLKRWVSRHIIDEECSLIQEFEFEWRLYALSAYDAIFRARTCRLYRIFYMPSRSVRAGHTKAFIYPLTRKLESGDIVLNLTNICCLFISKNMHRKWQIICEQHMMIVIYSMFNCYF